MARKEVFSEKELEEMADEAIVNIASQNPFLYEIDRMDVTKYLEGVYPGFTYYHSGKEVMRSKIRDFNERKEILARKGNPSINKMERFFKNIDVDIIMNDIKFGRRELREVLIRIKEESDNLVRSLQVTRDENTKMAEYVAHLSTGNQKSTQNIVERANEWERKYKEEVKKTAELQRELELIEDRAARLVIKDCHMGIVEVVDDNRARSITYLEDRKRKRLKELRGEKNDE